MRNESEFQAVSLSNTTRTSLDQYPRPKGMPTRVLRANAAALPRHNLVMDEGLKAGIAATACSIFVLFIILLAMLALPMSIG